ncbi:hypothetical protein HY570_04400 [Candidatus Micrarchaeota archaeon]|nr:hypothetical protein [Candidatus Micrarchaeota archaeon]
MLIPAGLRLTCYYFHGWLEERLLRPLLSLFSNPKDLLSYDFLKGFSLDRLHRYFVILSIPLLLIHVSITLYHTIAPVSSWIQLNSLENFSYVAKFTLNPSIWSFKFTLFNLSEWLDSIMLFLYVGSCHVVRYSCGSGEKCISCNKQKILSAHTKLNRFHDRFFWASIVTVSIHTAFVIAVNTGIVGI